MFERAAGLARQSGMVLVVFLSAVLITAIGASYFVEDYMTSVMGYQMWPSRHYFDWIIWVGALTPQVGQVFFAWLAADSKGRWWAWVVTGVLFLVDTVPDVMYKSLNTNISILATIVEAILMYTIASEVFLALGLGVGIELFPDAVNAGRKLAERLRPRPTGEWGMTGRSTRPAHATGQSRHPMSQPTISHDEMESALRGRLGR